MLVPGHAVNATIVNATLAMANATLVEGGERAASAAGSVVQDSKGVAAGLLSGVRALFNQSSSTNSE